MNILQDTDIEIEMESQLRQLEKENQTLTNELERRTKELFDVRQDNSSQSKLNQNLDEGMSILQLQVETDSKQIENLNNSISSLTKDKSDQEYQLALQSEQLTSLKQQLAFDCTELDNLNILVKSLRDDNDIICDHNSSVQSELEQIVDQLKDANNNNKRLNDQLAERARDLLLSQQNNATQLEKISLLESELQQKERLEVESLREASFSSERVEKQLSSARKDRDQYKSKISELKSSIESLNTEKNDIQSALDLATQSVNDSKLNLDSAKTNYNQLKLELDKVCSEKDKLTSRLTTIQDELSQLRHQLDRKDTELNSLLKTTETASSEMNLLHQGVTSKENECRALKEHNIMLKEDAKRMQGGFDSALELIQNKLDKSEQRVSELEVINKDRESVTNNIRGERAITEANNTQLQEQLNVLRENQQNQIALQPENERLHKLTSEQSAQLNSTQNELERLQQENIVLRSSQENTLSGVQEQEVKSLQLSQGMAHLSRENEKSNRKLSEVNRMLEEVEFERDQLKQENTNINDYITKLQTLQRRHDQVVSELSTVKDHLSVERENWQKERAELVSQQPVEPLLATIPVSPEHVEVPAATTYYITQLEERLQNDTLEQEKLKSSQLEVALNKSSPSDGLPLPATAISEDFSCLNQSTLGDCVTVLRNQLMRWKANPKITMTRFFKSRPLPQLLVMVYFICLHFLVLFSLL
ncbi:Leucine-rich repeat-containing protein [Oopsacas minuta]|uniref:Leucine-rich repeat-containing protein n=1 Tax=Oopsacas minuta TaxID=111878 RepID=A0AAV7K9Z0_9METZ|nr:Leucine-rich repeat-containing protein [Oopsacas minuta]